MESLVGACPECVWALNQFQQTGLHLASARAGNYDLPIVQFLAEKYPEALRQRDVRGSTPLHAACLEYDSEQDNTEVIEYLAHACREILEPHGLDRIPTPLHDVCERSYYDREIQLDMIRVLSISPAAVRAKDSLGRTPLHLLARSGNLTLEACQVLVGQYPNLPFETDDQGRTPLHLAVEGSVNAIAPNDLSKYTETVEVLLQHYPALAQVRDNLGMTPLDVAWQTNVRPCIAYPLVRNDPVEMLQLWQRTRPATVIAYQTKHVLSQGLGIEQEYTCRGKRLERYKCKVRRNRIR
jgi:ankyrin repeat protein